jgi:hypothetical protein
LVPENAYRERLQAMSGLRRQSRSPSSSPPPTPPRHHEGASNRRSADDFATVYALGTTIPAVTSLPLLVPTCARLEGRDIAATVTAPPSAASLFTDLRRLRPGRTRIWTALDGTLAWFNDRR